MKFFHAIIFTLFALTAAGKELSPHCGHVHSAEMSENEKVLLLDQINTFRQQQENDLKADPLVWDPQLADMAQSWVNNCNFTYDDFSTIDLSQWEYLAQTVGLIEVQGLKKESTVIDLLQIWKAAEDQRAILIRKETKRIGCGSIKIAMYGSSLTFLVCNYAQNLPKQQS